MTGSRPIAAPLAALLLVLGCGAAAAGDAAAGRRKALASCQVCHGLDGMAKLPDAPHIAGQPEPYLVKALNDYRTGDRKHELMSIAVKELSDADVADLAAYYASIEIMVVRP